MFKLNKRNSRKRCEMLKVNNKDTQTTSMNIFKYTSHIALMFLLLTWNMWSIFGFCVYLYNCDFILNIWLLTYFTNEINDAVLVPLLLTLNWSNNFFPRVFTVDYEQVDLFWVTPTVRSTRLQINLNQTLSIKK